MTVLAVVLIFMSGCASHIFDPNYYKAKKYAKKYSGTYVVNSEFYAEIQQNKQDSKKLHEQRMVLQDKLRQEIKYQKNTLWLENQEKYKQQAFSRSGYYNHKNAQTLFIFDELEKRLPVKKPLSNGKMYYSYLDFVNQNLEIEPFLLEKIGGKTQKDTKYKRIVYPQYFYFDDNNAMQIISLGVVYLYVNTNNVYRVQEDASANIFFVNGQWHYLVKPNLFYLEH